MFPLTRKMHHGTCSDYNQYCPNARLSRQQHQHHHHDPLLESFSLGNLRGGFPYPETPPTPFSKQRQCSPPKRLRRPLRASRSQLSLSTEPLGGGGSRSYHPLVQFEDQPEDRACQYPQLSSRLSHDHDQRFPCGTSFAGSVARETVNTPTTAGTPSTPLDCYQEHIFQFFYHHQHKQAGRVSSRSSDNNNISSLPGNRNRSLSVHVATTTTATTATPPSTPIAPTPASGDNLNVLNGCFFNFCRFISKD